MKKIILSNLILITLLISTSLQAQTAYEISDKASKLITFEAMEMTSTLVIMDAKGNSRIRKVSNATKKFGDATKTIIKFISPADVKGTAMLIYDYETNDDDMWVYLPSLRKTRRIVSSEKSNSFMGSEFSNSDMSKPNMADFNYKLVGTEEYMGKTCWKIESTCKTDKIQKELKISKKIAYIEKDTYLTHKIDYYSIDKKLYKTTSISNYKQFENGKYFAYKMSILNHKNHRKSEITINKLVEGSSLSESHFSSLNLDK